MRHRESLLVVAVILIFGSSAALAAPCTSTDASVVGTSSTDDVTLNGQNSDACEIVPSQNSGQAGGEFGTSDPAFAPSSSWTELYHNETGGSGASDSFGPINGITFSNYQFSTSGLSGSFGFDWSGGPAYIDFVFSMHAGGNSAYFLFDEVHLAPASGSGAGTWVIEWFNNGQQNPDYSNVQFWGRAGNTVPIRPQVEPVPEPQSIMLVALALGLLASGRWLPILKRAHGVHRP